MNSSGTERDPSPVEERPGTAKTGAGDHAPSSAGGPSRNGSAGLGKSLKPVVGYGPVVSYVNELRGAAKRSLTAIGQLINYSKSHVSGHLNGSDLPNREFVQLYLGACGADAETAAGLLDRYASVEQAAQRFRPDGLERCARWTDLSAQLRALMRAEKLTPARIIDRLRDAARLDPRAPWVNAPTERRLKSALRYDVSGLTAELVAQIVRSSGGTDSDAKVWLEQHEKIANSQPVPPRRTPLLRRRWAIATATTVVLGGAVLVWFALTPHAETSGPSVAPSAISAETCGGLPSTPSDPPVPGVNPEVRVALLDLDRQIMRRGDPPLAGRYTYIHTQVWSRDTTAPITDDRGTLHDERSWRANDGSGRRVTTEVVTGGSSVPPQIEEYEPGKFAVPFPNLPSNPTLLGRQLDQDGPPELGPVRRLRAIAKLYASQTLDCAQRATVLRVLADTPGLAYRDRQPGEGSRDSVAVSADFSNDAGKIVRETLLLDLGTGAVRRHETVEVPGQHSTSQVPYVITYRDYLEWTRTDNLGQ